MDESQQVCRHRHQVYWTLMLIALCIVAGRIATVSSKEGDTAFLSANDRSRWCTIAALVEARTYKIDQLINLKNKQGRRPWYTIDLVRHRGDDGQLHYYSSKPPLLPTLVAGVYWLFYQATGMTLSEQPVYAVRIMLALINLPLLALFYGCTIGAIERIGSGAWSRKFAAAATCFGTMLMPFAVSLNNHLVAATATAVVMYIYVRAASRRTDPTADPVKSTSAWAWMIAGAAAAFAAANELPALSMTAFWLLLVLLLDFRGAISFVIGLLIVAAAFFATNKFAHDSFRPPYMHRNNGVEIASFENSAVLPDAATVSSLLSESGVDFDQVNELSMAPSGIPDRWVIRSQDNHLFALNRMAPDRWKLSHWDDWYDYPSSYWRGGTRKGVDLGEPSRANYFLHMTVGHHGVLSLTPIWLLVPLGFIVGMLRGPGSIRRLVFAIAVASVVCMAFYVMRPEIDRNYGGVSACFRWLLWFAPLWLLASVPVMDAWCRRLAGRVFLLILLASSVFSMATSLDSPWQHPWIYQYWSFLGWIGG